MPMISCPECGRLISSYAPTCPGCGVPQEIIQKLLSGQEMLKMQPEPTQKTKPVHQEIVRTETLHKKSRARKIRTIHCVICKKEYLSDGAAACPRCEYPSLSVQRNKQRTKEEIKEYKKKVGIHAFIELKVGQFFKMGHYGGEEINWRVLAVKGKKALLISEKGLDAKPYNEKFNAVTWETCSLRKWLNCVFYNSAFGAVEKELIITTKVPAEKNPKYNTDPGKATEDKIFLLSIKEAEKYFTSHEDRKAYPTVYAKANGAWEHSNTRCCWWWLRSPGRYSFNATFIPYDGLITHDGGDVRGGDVCVRPAMWINL